MNKPNSFIGVVCGLKSEAAAVLSALGDDARIRIGVSGANAQRAESIARQYCAEGARAILSVGVSGGLHAELNPGDLLISTKVLVKLEGDYKEINTPLSANKLRSIDSWQYANTRSQSDGAPVPNAIYGRFLLGSDEIIQTADQKIALFETTKALAVDMESHGCARAAKEAGVPFLAIRTIADPADRALPPAALGAVAPDGSTRVLKTLGAALRDPKQFPELMKLGADNSAALKTLRRDLGPLFRSLFLALDL